MHDNRAVTWNEVIRLVQSATDHAIVRVSLPDPDEEEDGIDIADDVYTEEDVMFTGGD